MQERLVHGGERGRAPLIGYIQVCKNDNKIFIFSLLFILVIHHQNAYFLPILVQRLPIGTPPVGHIFPMHCNTTLSTEAPPSSISLQYKWIRENWGWFIWVHGIIDTVILWMWGYLLVWRISRCRVKYLDHSAVAIENYRNIATNIIKLFRIHVLVLHRSYSCINFRF